MEEPSNGCTHAQRVLSLLNLQRSMGRFCDAMLSVENGQVHLAHRNVLACFSQLFQDSIEASSTPCMEVNLPQDCPNDGLELLLDFFYTGQLVLDTSNLDKVRLAASTLSVPDDLIPYQDPVNTEASQVDFATPETGEGKPVINALSLDLKADPASKRKSKSRQGVKNKAEATSGTPVLEPSVAGLDEYPTAPLTTTTTTRSGRRIRGPSWLTGENPLLVTARGGTSRRRTTPVEAKEEMSTVHEQDQTSPLVPSENEEAKPVDSRNDGADDNDEDDDGEDGGGIDGVTEDTDEEYVPESEPSTDQPQQQGRRRLRGSTARKENGEGTGKEKKKGSVECPTCHKTFLSKYYLKVHNRRHTGEKPFECSKCGKCYYRKENLQEHEARNCLSRAEVVFSCSRCTMTFRKRLELRLHMVTHTGEMPNKCTSCTEQFMQKKDLRIHMIKVHGAPKPHACSLCSKCFLSRTELRLHEASKHRGEKLFVCEECGHRASSRNGLQMHIKAIHRNERPFVCEFCSHAFTQKANLNMHLRTHTGEKPFQCHLCGKTFRTQASLDKHNRTHTGERPYACEFCEQRFTEKGPLLRHVASKHQEGRPHLCNICGKTFKAIEQLRVHLRRHKGMRKFECTECGYKFTRQAHLRRHSQIHSRVENYNPRQRRLRNLVVDEEGFPETSSTPDEEESQVEVSGLGSGENVSMDLQAGSTALVEEVVSGHGVVGVPGDQVAVFPGAPETAGGEEGDFGGATATGEVDAGLMVAEVMEHSLLVSDPYAIQQPNDEVELEEAGVGGKA